MRKMMGKILGLTMLGAVCMSSTALAEEAMLARTEFKTADKALVAELWADQLHSGYNRQLQLLIKNTEGKVVTAYNPDINGGYGCLLEAVSVEDKGQQLMLSVAQGDWRSNVEYRILDVSKPAAIKEVFNSTDSMGLVTYAKCADGVLELKMSNGESIAMPISPAIAELLGRRTHFGGIYSLTPYDADDDGKQELLLSQRISSGKTAVADVGALLQLDDKGKWQPFGMTLMATPAPDKNNTVNEGRELACGTIVPRRIVVPGGEATYPVFINNNKQELQKQFNKVLQEENKAYMQEFYDGYSDIAFNIVTADEDIVSIRLVCGKDSFKHHHVNIDPATGKLMKLEEILDTKNPDLLPLLEVLSGNINVSFDSLPQEWYIEGRNLFFIQTVCGKEECAGFDLGNLHKYILDKKWLSRKAQ